MVAAALEREGEGSETIRTSVRCGRRPSWRSASNDKKDFQAIAERLAREMPNAQLAVIPGAAHLPSMSARRERPRWCGASFGVRLACDASARPRAGRGLALASVPAASAQAAECPPGSPTLVVMVNGKTSGPVYTTHDLLVRTRLSGGACTP